MPTTPHRDEDLFSAALEMSSAEERLAFLEDHCRNDPERLQRLLELFEGYEQGKALEKASPLAEIAPVMPMERELAEKPGTVIDRYKLLEKIGEGGFGVVYLAEQREPVVRKVALKIIKLGMDTKQVIARFEAERQALALMDHPNIARIIDAGATATGRPYFVMELVTGVSITRYCEEARLGVAERLKLFIPVCQAVQHAHQKGLIHRDLKPSNVMVTLHDGVPVPKVIDFGVSKALNQRLTERTLFTNYAQMVGTPAYMSPEQAEMSGLDVDTRSDIYSLGVLLYELLTGTPPHDAKRLGSVAYGEMQRIIREEDPPLPSTRLTTTRRSSPTVGKARVMDGEIPRDLDWVVMKCLEKDRHRRYETANEFVRDVERFLNDEPVEAAAPGLFYRLGKYARRNRLAVTAGATVAVVILVALVVSTLLLFQAREANRVAEARRLEAEAAAKQGSELTELLEEAIMLLGPSGTMGRARSEIVDELAGELSRGNDKTPEVIATMQYLLGRLYLDLGEFGSAREILKASLDTRVEYLGNRHPYTIAARVHLAAAQRWLPGEVKAARENCEEAIKLYEETLPPDHRDLLEAKQFLSSISYADERWQESRKLALEVVEGCRRSLEPGDLLTIKALNGLGVASSSSKEALPFWEEGYQQSLASKESLAYHPVVLNLRGNLALARLTAARSDQDLAQKAFAMFESIRDDSEDGFGDASWEVAISRSNLAVAHAVLGDLDNAVKLHQSALLFLDDPGRGREWAGAFRMMGSLRCLQGKSEEAIQCYQQITAFPREWSNSGIDWLRLGALLVQNGDLQNYEALCRRGLGAAEDPKGMLKKEELVMACLLTDLGPKNDLQTEAIKLARQSSSDHSDSSGKGLFGELLCRGMAEYRAGNFEEAIRLFSHQRISETKSPRRGAALAFHAMAAMEAGQVDEARRLLEEAATVIETIPKPENWQRIRLAGEAVGQGWMTWHDDLICRLALKEARSTVLGNIE